VPETVYPIVEATYEGDTLRLHDSLPLREQQTVWVVVVPAPGSESETEEARSPDEILRLAAEVYEGLFAQDLQEIEALALDRSQYFAGRA
jgi:hypothetical protein